MGHDRRLTARLGIELPILQAPMASISTAALAAEVSEGGGLGQIGSALLPPPALETQVAVLRARTSRPFGLNFFVHAPPDAASPAIAAMRERLAPLRASLGVIDMLSAVPPPFGAAMLEVVLALRPPVVSFHFGLPDEAAVHDLHAAGIVVMSSATTVDEARALEARGADAIIAQGLEAGGHRGMFAATLDEQRGLRALLPDILAAVKVPVIAAGGIVDGGGIAAALALGASAVQLGTAFLGCPEAELDPHYRATLFQPRAAQTRITTVLSGRPARAIATRFLDELADMEGHTAPFPIQRALTAPLSMAAMAKGDLELHAMWAGQGAPLTRALPARELVATLAREAGL